MVNDRPSLAGHDVGMNPVHAPIAHTLHTTGKPVHSMLYMFAGPRRVGHGDMDECCKEHAVKLEALDVIRDQSHDLLDDHRWAIVEKRIKDGQYSCNLSAPPCCTFSPIRGKRNGPRPLRSIQHPYGLPDLTPDEKKQTREGTACALRALTAAKLFNEMGLPFVVETSGKYEGVLNLFELPQYADFLKEHPEVTIREVVQCFFGASSVKPSRLMTNVDLDIVPDRCTHPKSWWR